jgi:hypothetical protein
MNEYQKELARLLKLSTLTPGTYSASEDFVNSSHEAVFVNEHPVILCGPAGDQRSMEEAKALSASSAFRQMMQAAGWTVSEVYPGVSGQQIRLGDQFAAIVSKESGQVEDGSGDGPLVAVILDSVNGTAIAAALCVNTEIARIFDPAVPELDDGRRLSMLSCQGNVKCESGMTFSAPRP